MKTRKMNENDLINTYSKEQLVELLAHQIKFENYEGAAVVKSAIEQYDDATIDNDSEEIFLK
jgi:protein-arginine kinase activator protein McsA